MGEIADYYVEEFYKDRFPFEGKMSATLSERVGRYSVDEEDIKHLIFVVSTRTLCQLADIVISDFYPEEKYDSAEMNKIIDIAAWGLAKKHLTEKQKWCLASFIIYYSDGELSFN